MLAVIQSSFEAGLGALLFVGGWFPKKTIALAIAAAARSVSSTGTLKLRNLRQATRPSSGCKLVFGQVALYRADWLHGRFAMQDSNT